MQNNKLRILAASTLLMFTALGSACGNNGQGGQSSDSTEATSSAEESEQIKGKITGLDSVPPEIGEGETIDLDDYLTVTKVSSWSVFSDSPNVKIEGHKVTGLDYGEFTLTIYAGLTQKTITGNVITEEKAEFNKMVLALGQKDLNFTSMFSMMGLYRYVTKDYWLERNDVHEIVPDMQYHLDFSGALLAEDNAYHAFNIGETISYVGEQVTEQWDDEISVLPGKGQSHSAAGITGWSAKVLSPYAFTEMLDEDDDPSGIFLFKDTSDDQSTLQALYNGLFGGGYNILASSNYNVKAKGIAAFIGDDGYLNLYPVNSANQIVQTLKDGTESFSTAAYIGGVGETKVDAVDAFLENQHFPEEIDHSDLNQFYVNLAEAKQYSLHGYGKWYNPKTGGAVSRPKGMSFEDGNSPLSIFELDSMANADARVIRVTEAERNLFLQPDSASESKTVIKGDCTIEIVDKELGYYSSKGVYDFNQQSTAWQAATHSSESDLESIWDSSFMPTIFAPIELSGGELVLLDEASFYSKEILEGSDNAVAYGVNNYGDDMAYPLIQGYAYGVNAFALGSLGVDFGFTLALYIGFWELGNEFTCTFTVSADGNTVVYAADWEYSETVHYQIGYSISITEEDPMDQSTINFINETLGREVPPAGGDIVDEGGEN